MSDSTTSAGKRTRSRTSNYEDLDSLTEPSPSILQRNHDSDDFLPPLQELEMNSVSVVPDGSFVLNYWL